LRVGNFSGNAIARGSQQKPSKEALRLLVRHFDDPLVGAVAGNAKVGNRRNLVTNCKRSNMSRARISIVWGLPE
jgi:hypothetical protein